MNHPFHKKFLESLNIELEKFGVKIEDTKIDHFHNMFDIKKMKAMLFQYGFNLLTIDFDSYKSIVKEIANQTNRVLIPFNDTEKNLVGIIDVRNPLTDIENFIVNGGIMRYFNNKKIRNLSEVEKQLILKKIFDEVKQKYPDLLEKPVAETDVFFVAQSV